MRHNISQRIIASDGPVAHFFKVCCVPAFMLSWLILSACGCYAVLKGQTAVGLTDGAGRPFGDCFINFWSAARLTFMGRVSEIYSWEGFHAFQQDVVHAHLIYFHYSYPPVMPLLTLPLAWLPYVPALFVWLFVTWAMFYLALRTIQPTPALTFFLSLATPAFIFNVASGQNGALTAALLGGGLALLPRRPLMAGVLFGLLCFKPQLVFLVPVALICGKQWRTLMAAAVTSLCLMGCSYLLYGAGIWQEYRETTHMLRHYVLEDNTAQSWQQFVSIFVAARELGASILMAYILQGVFGLIALGAIIKLWTGSASHDVRCAALIMGTFMTTPYAMDYDLVVMAFVAVWLSRSYRHSFWPVALMLVTPILSTSAGTYYGVGIGPLLLLPSFILILSSCELPKMISHLYPQTMKT